MTNSLGILIITAYVWTGQKCANNRWPVADVTCAASQNIPLGTWLDIAGLGWYRVDDRINQRFHGTRIDLYFGPKNRTRLAKKFGARPHQVRVVK